MINITHRKELLNEDLTIKDQIRISRSKKDFAVMVNDRLYLVNDIDRLFLDRLRHEIYGEARIYYLKE